MNDASATRAGRSATVRRRITTGLLLSALVVCCTCFFPSGLVIALVLLLALKGQWEFYAMLRGAGRPVAPVLGCFWGALLVVAASVFCRSCWHGLEIAVQALLLLSLSGAMLVGRPECDGDRLAALAYTLLGVLYVPFLLGFVLRVAFAWDSSLPWQVPDVQGRMLGFYLIVVVKLSDIGAYAVGSLIGRHKMFPRISPAKSWEGLAGGLLAGLLGSLAYLRFVPRLAGAHGIEFGDLSLTGWDALALGLLLPAVGVVGDLVESLFKRTIGAKDAGRMLPGMGGVLDVLDSVLFAAPVLYGYLIVMSEFAFARGATP